MKVFKKLLCMLPLAAALPVCAAPPEELIRISLCPAAENMQLFYYYLKPGIEASLKDHKTHCPGSEESVKMPGWLQKAAPAMAERMVWKDPEEGNLSEAALWQTPVSVLYEFTETTRKTLPGPAGETPVSPFILEKEYNDMRTRLILSVERLARARLNDSFEGRGKGLFSTLNRIMERMDALTGAISARDKAGFYKGAGEAAGLSKDLFAQLFSAPRLEPGYRYRPQPRILDGYRGVSLPVPGYQTLFLNSGERVDLLVTFEAIMGKGAKEMVTATILQNVVVLKVSRPDAIGGTGVVQLLCNPNEAQYATLSLAQCKSVNIARRAAGDVELHPMEIASFVKLFK
ncbi:MAG: hypothetical protein KKH28_14280 [Elusimicrobia bacterium]|nr:hypothetical protein [Elusimicrobiota bacterium]